MRSFFFENKDLADLYTEVPVLSTELFHVRGEKHGLAATQRQRHLVLTPKIFFDACGVVF